MRLSPPSQKPLLRTRDLAQYSLPYPVEDANSNESGQADGVIHSRPLRPSDRIAVPLVPNARVFGTSKRDEKRKPPAEAKIPPHAKILVGREEAANFLSISVRSVDYLIATGRLSTRRIGTRVLIPMEDVRRFARSDHPERMAG
jgi:excisionase family DNA binding protein